jgi:hypothetical protein
MNTMNQRRGAPTRAGGSLLEVLVIVAVLALLLAMAGMSVSTSRGAYGQGMLAADAEVQARRALEWIAAELQGASAASVGVDGMAPPPPADAITWLDYREITGFAGSAQMGEQRRLQLVLQAGELDDGLDNNGNGLVDECRIELLTDVLGSARAAGLIGLVRRLAEGELDNGLDDNGDGQVDEPGFGALWEPLEPGASGMRGGSLSLWLSLERKLAGQRAVMRTVRTSVRVRSQ